MIVDAVNDEVAALHIDTSSHVSEWHSFEFNSLDAVCPISPDMELQTEEDIMNTIEKFFSDLPSELTGLGLTENKYDAVMKMFSEIIKKTNKLSECLIRDSNGLSPIDVCTYNNNKNNNLLQIFDRHSQSIQF